MKKSMKIFLVVLMMLSMILVSTSVFAANETEEKVDTDKPSKIVSPDTNTTGIDNVKGIGNDIVGIIRVVGTIVAVAMIIVLGIKYMMGSAEERAEYKKTLFPYFVGAVLIFAATSLADIIYGWAVNLGK